MQRTRRRTPRTEIACTECRARKLKCEGSRPSCSRCRTVHLECIYHQLPTKNLRKARYERVQGDLLRRIEQLEDQLRLVSNARAGAFYHDQDDRQLTPQTSPGVCQFDENNIQPSESEETVQTVDDDEATVDLIATDAFNEKDQCYAGYFGPCSNHAAFQFLSTAFSRISMLYMPINLDDVLEKKLPETHSHKKLPDSSTLFRKTPLPKNSNEIFNLPSKSDGIHLLHKFFSSVGIMLPYLSSADLVQRYEQARNINPPRFSRVFLVLLNIIWAHASASLSNAQSEVFYHRAIGLLNLHTLQGSSYDLVQSLLLLVLFQQNHQRSVSSYTTHALCVKAAFQTGLHVSNDESYSLDEERSRQLLWAAVVNNDRVFSLTQGRPLMISETLSHFEWDDNISSDVNMSSRHFIYLTRLNTILASAIEVFYISNYKTLGQPAISELICRRHHLFCKLKQWQDDLTSFKELISSVSAIDGLSRTSPITAMRVVLSICYYRACMVINFPLIASLLETLLQDKSKDWELGHLRQNSHQAIQHDWIAITELCETIQAIHNSSDDFIKTYAAHYMCNYTLFTATLHLFAILLIHKQDPIPGMSLQQIRQKLDAYLSAMEIFEQTSLMTWKARRCIYRLLLVFDNLGDEIINIPSAFTEQGTDEFIREYTGQSINDLLQQCSQDELNDSDPSFMDLYSSIPLCE